METHGQMPRDMMGLFANKNYFLLNTLVCIFIKNRSTSGRSISGRELVCTLNFGVNSILVKVAPSSQRMSPSPFSRVHLRGTIFFFHQKPIFEACSRWKMKKIPKKIFKLKRKAKKNYNKLKTKKRHLGFFRKRYYVVLLMLY